MDIKKISILSFLLIGFSVQAEEFTILENGEEKKIYSMDNQIVLHSQNGENQRLRTNGRQTRSVRLGDKVSEVFADSPQGEGRIRSLPGGIIVQLTAGIDAEAWFSEHSLKKVKVLKENQYLVESTPGRKTLEEVGEIRQLAGVETVAPNWWTEMESKSKLPKNFKPKRKPTSNFLKR